MKAKIFSISKEKELEAIRDEMEEYENYEELDDLIDEWVSEYKIFQLQDE